MIDSHLDSTRHHRIGHQLRPDSAAALHNTFDRRPVSQTSKIPGRSKCLSRLLKTEITVSSDHAAHDL
jgi:hypothetical protein